jgi:hypothetical protein
LVVVGVAAAVAHVVDVVVCADAGRAPSTSPAVRLAHSFRCFVREIDRHVSPLAPLTQMFLVRRHGGVAGVSP